MMMMFWASRKTNNFFGLLGSPSSSFFAFFLGGGRGLFWCLASQKKVEEEEEEINYYYGIGVGQKGGGKHTQNAILKTRSKMAGTLPPRLKSFFSPFSSRSLSLSSRLVLSDDG